MQVDTHSTGKNYLTLGEKLKSDSDKIMELTWDSDPQSKVAYIYDYFHDDFFTDEHGITRSLAEGMTYGLTPIMAYFVIYLAYMEKYNTSDNPIGIFKILNYQKKYALATGAVLLILLIIWYLVGLPIGINVMPTI